MELHKQKRINIFIPFTSYSDVLFCVDFWAMGKKRATIYIIILWLFCACDF